MSARSNVSVLSFQCDGEVLGTLVAVARDLRRRR
jgi:hypothetical protein